MAIDVGLYDWWLDEGDDGHLDYTVVWLCVTTDPTDGPQTIRAASGIPTAGSVYVFGSTYVYARRPKQTKRVSTDPGDRRRWYVTQVFSTRPLTRVDLSGPVGNPLLEPPKIRGSALKYMRRFSVDRNGDPILSSSGERYTGPEVEDDDNNLRIVITQNVASVNLLTFRTVLKTTPWNSATLWGLPEKTIRFTDFDVEKLYLGDSTAYYSQTLTFEIGGDFARQVLDEGTMEFVGTDRANPKHYARVKDGRGENLKKVPLDGNGGVLTDLTSPVFNSVELKGTSNLLLLGIPSSI